MDSLLKNICDANGLQYEIFDKIIKIEKNNVYKKKRNIFGDLKEVVYKTIEAEETQNDN